MKAIIIDDEPLARTILREYLLPYTHIAIVDECNNGFEGLKSIQQHQPDLIFLDIQMPKISGFEMLELIENPPNVIFTTAFEEYAIKAFETHAVDYLLKPFSADRFNKAMQRLLQQQAPQKTEAVLETAALLPANINRIVVKDGNKIKIIPLGQVHYLEAADDYVKIHSADGTYLKKRTMQHFETLLQSHHFIRVHRSYILNAQLITRIDVEEKDLHTVLLNNGARLPVSKAGYSRLREVLGI